MLRMSSSPLQRVEDGAGAQEQAGLEERVRNEVEERRRENAPTPQAMNMKPSCEIVE